MEMEVNPSSSEKDLFMLVCNWPHSDWTKSIMCKDAFQ
jgi:hypothetical protein